MFSFSDLLIRIIDLKLKERVIIVFLAKDSCAPKEIHNRLKNVYGNFVIDVSNVRIWVKKFGYRDMETAYKSRSGRPTTSVIDTNQTGYSSECCRSDTLSRMDQPKE